MGCCNSVLEIANPAQVSADTRWLCYTYFTQHGLREELVFVTRGQLGIVLNRAVYKRWEAGGCIWTPDGEDGRWLGLAREARRSIVQFCGLLPPQLSVHPWQHRLGQPASRMARTSTSSPCTLAPGSGCGTTWHRLSSWPHNADLGQRMTAGKLATRKSALLC